MILQGPDQTNSLVDVLMRFMLEKVVFIADIKSMFKQVRVPDSERDLLRFLWWEEGDPANKIVQNRMMFELFGILAPRRALHATPSGRRPVTTKTSFLQGSSLP